MKTINEKIFVRLTELTQRLFNEKRITEDEANAILFYGLYKNPLVKHYAVTMDKDGYPIVNSKAYSIKNGSS